MFGQLSTIAHFRKLSILGIVAGVGIVLLAVILDRTSKAALNRIDKLAESGHPGAKTLATYWVGQGVGMMNDSLSARTVVIWRRCTSETRPSGWSMTTRTRSSPARAATSATVAAETGDAMSPCWAAMRLMESGRSGRMPALRATSANSSGNKRAALAIGDFDRDGVGDLAAGAPGAARGSECSARSGFPSSARVPPF